MMAGMVKRSRIRFPGMMGTVDVPTAATKIVTNMRRRAAILFIPDKLLYITNFVRYGRDMAGNGGTINVMRDCDMETFQNPPGQGATPPDRLL